MRMKMAAAALVVAPLLILQVVPAGAETPVRSGNAVFDGVVQLVLANFYAPGELERFRDAVGLTVTNLPDLASADSSVVTDAVDFVLGSLQTSHTARYTPDDVDYYELMDVFRFAVRDGVRRLFPPDGDVRYEGIGMATSRIDGATFATDVYDGSAADRAGLMAGDEILAVDGLPFSEIASFKDRTGKTVTLAVRRARNAEPIEVPVTVAKLQATRALLDGIANSAEIVERDGFRIGYLRLWSYTARETAEVIDRALAGPLAEADGLVLDLRCRWGGAPSDAADTFVGGAPDVTMVSRNRAADLANVRWRKPLVAIIDEGTRSGMEILAYGLKTNGVKMVGAKTAGAVVAGRGYMLPDDSLMILAVADVFVDGARLEGVGVAPDIAVPFDVRYAGGADPQREAAFAEMARNLSHTASPRVTTP